MPSKIRPSVWDDSEPDYAPYYKEPNGIPRWVCPQKYVKAGYNIKTYRLEGQPGDDLDLERARQCRELTRELLNWWSGQEKSRINPGTWGYVSQHYIHDDCSPIKEVRPGTREGYIKVLDRITAAIADVKVADTDHAQMSKWKRAMEEKGRSSHYIKKWFTHFGLLISYAIVLRVPGGAEVKAIRSEMRIKNPPKRAFYATRDDINAVIEAADQGGEEWLSLSLLFRFEFVLRGVDVYGQWVPAEGRKGGIQHHERRWEGGITWEMIDRKVTTLSKTISKTRDSLPEPYEFDLRQVPAIRKRLLAIPEEERIGPVIKVEDGLPPRNDRATKAFKRIVRDLELPETLRISDARSGAITEAKSAVDPMTLRDAAQHTQISTTDGYVRGRSEAANKVVRLRRK